MTVEAVKREKLIPICHGVVIMSPNRECHVELQINRGAHICIVKNMAKVRSP